MQGQEDDPNEHRLWVGVAVLLLVSSGVTLPLTSFAAAPAPARSASGRVLNWDFAGQPTVQSNEKAFLDGVPPAFDVAPPAVAGSQQSKSGIFVVLCESVRGTTPGMTDEDNSCTSFRTQKAGFMWGGPPAEQGQGYGFWISGPSSGAMIRIGTAGEMVLGPTSTSISSVTAAIPKVWWDFSQRRSKFEIYVEILELMKRGPMTPFEVAFYARLNHKRTKEYAELLAEKGYLQAVNEGGKTLYVLTKEGLGFLERARSLFIGPKLIEVATRGYQRDF